MVRAARQGSAEAFPIDWLAVTGKWDGRKARHAGVDSGKLWATMVKEFPQMSRTIEEVGAS